MRLIDADAIYQWYTDTFDFGPNEIRFSMNDIRENLDNIPTVDLVPSELSKGGRMMTRYLLAVLVSATVSIIINLLRLIIMLKE